MSEQPKPLSAEEEGLIAELRAWRTAFDTYLYEDMAHAARHFNEAQKLRALNGG